MQAAIGEGLRRERPRPSRTAGRMEGVWLLLAGARGIAYSRSRQTIRAFVPFQPFVPGDLTGAPRMILAGTAGKELFYCHWEFLPRSIRHK